MKVFKEGDKSKAICSDCKILVPTTFRIRPVPFSSGKVIVPDILVAVCDFCDSVVSLPQQSVPKVARSLSEKFVEFKRRNFLNSARGPYYFGICEYCPIPPNVRYKKRLVKVLVGSWALNLICLLIAYQGPDFMMSKNLWFFSTVVCFFNFLFLGDIHYKLFVIKFFPKTLLLEIPRLALTSNERKSFALGLLFIITHLLIGTTLVFQVASKWKMLDYQLF